MSESSTRVYGKWILTGEHTVLRGGSALVFPAKACFFDLKYVEKNNELNLICESEQGEQLKFVFLGILEKALGDLGRSRSEIRGDLYLANTVPLAGGMGASAALCVTVTRFLNFKNWVTDSDMYMFAKNLEHLFHGESSGVDIAAAIKSRPLIFKIPGDFVDFNPAWRPHFRLSHCGKRGVTADCIQRVKHLWIENKSLAEQIDEDMKKSFHGAHHALMQSEDAFTELQEAIRLSSSCFERWGLISVELREHMSFLQAQGAAAVKPTGSGDGGFVLSLWRTPPPLSLSLMECM